LVRVCHVARGHLPWTTRRLSPVLPLILIPVRAHQVAACCCQFEPRSLSRSYYPTA
jgi:hypothetical protein